MRKRLAGTQLKKFKLLAKSKATKEVVFFGYPRNSHFSFKQLARSTRVTERWFQEADGEAKQKWLKDIEEDKSNSMISYRNLESMSRSNGNGATYGS